jgi:hypothetical protein
MIVLITRGPFCCAISLTRFPRSHFFAYVSTQFGCTIRSVQCNNGREFDNSSTRTFFLSHGVQLRMSCPYTSPQNGKAEPMIRTTNDVMRSLLFQASLLARYWAESLHAATYPLNLLPTKAISTPSPHFTLFGTTPSYAHLWVFGCTCYPNTSATAPHKLVPVGVSFLGTPPSTRGTGVSISTRTACWSPSTLSSMSHPFPLPPPAHLLTTWTPSSHPVLRFARLLHPTPLLLQILQSLTLRHTRLQTIQLTPRAAPEPPPEPRAAPVHQPAPPLPPPTPRAISASRFTAPPWCTNDDIRPPRQPSGAGSSVYHPVAVAHDPRRTHPMVTHRAVMVTEPVDRLQLSAAAASQHCLRSRPLSVAHARTPTGVALWRSTRPCCLTTRGTWFLSLLGPMSSPASESSSISSRRMALLIGTRLVGSSGASLSAPGWTTTRPSAPSLSLPPSGLC